MEQVQPAAQAGLERKDRHLLRLMVVLVPGDHLLQVILLVAEEAHQEMVSGLAELVV